MYDDSMFLGRKKRSLTHLQAFSNKSERCEIGRIVRGYQNTHFFNGQKRWNHLFNVVKLYLVKNWSGTLSFEDGDVQVHRGLLCQVQDKNLERKSHGDINLEGELSLFALSDDPEKKTQKIIISDLDDTVIKSRAVSLTRLVWTTLFSPVGKREVFPEVSSFYKKLKKGRSGKEDNLFFYISSSTWNIFPLLKSYLDHSDIPSGVLLLKEMDFGNEFKSSLKHSHKLNKIQFLLEFYPECEFILIGDAGQEDAFLYSEIIRQNPDRKFKAYIRLKWWEKVIEGMSLEHRDVNGVELTYFRSLSDIPEEEFLS